MRVAVFDPFSGASGDMILGALIEAGAPILDIQRELDKLALPIRLQAESVNINAVRGSRVSVLADDQSHSRTWRDIRMIITDSTLSQEVKGQAISIFERLAETYPTHVRADDAMYFRGQCFGQLAERSRAIAAFERLRTMYPESALADDGLYFAALAAKELKNCTEARTYLAILKSKYSKTNVSEAAQKLDAQIRKDARKRSVCAS